MKWICRSSTKVRQILASNNSPTNNTLRNGLNWEETPLGRLRWRRGRQGWLENIDQSHQWDSIDFTRCNLTAGLILTGRIWEFTDYDDSVGGAVPSGTILFEGVQIRIQNSPNALDLQIQGYETSKMYSAVMFPKPYMIINEMKDYFQVTSPPNSRHYNDMFRIRNVQESSFHPADPRRYLILTLERSELGHGNSYQ